jgi:hypothetical protein
MNEIVEQANIETMIYEIRGTYVMLSKDVAKLYNVETKALNQAIKRNLKRFPSTFCFQLTSEEYENLRSQFVTSSENNNYGGVRYLPYVLTEQGIIMLSGLLKSDIAVKVNIQIINAFVKIRKYISNNLIENNYYKNLIIKHDNEIKCLQESLGKLEEKQKANHIFFDGQIYDAYSLLMDILSKATSEIIIIDNYAGKELLDIIKDIKVRIIIVSSNINDILKKKYEEQYCNVEFINNNLFHDRFIIIDKESLYHCGASFKDLGKKCFAISKIEDKEYLKNLLNYLN